MSLSLEQSIQNKSIHGKSSSSKIASQDKLWKTNVLHRDLNTCPLQAIETRDLFYILLSNGRRVIDGAGGAAVACIGHGDERVKNAVISQMSKISYVNTQSYTTNPAEALARELLGHKPGGLTKALFLSSGSEAMEAAMKLARQYWVEKSELGRIKFISRRLSYHGNTLGALAVSGHPVSLSFTSVNRVTTKLLNTEQKSNISSNPSRCCISCVASISISLPA